MVTLHSIYEAIWKVPFLSRLREMRWERNTLKNLPILHCDVDALLSADEVDLDRIFNSKEIAAEWGAVMQDLRECEVSGTPAVNPGDRRAIFYLCSYFKPRSVLEAGTNVGASTIHIAAALKRYVDDEEKGLSFVTVDIGDVNDPISKPWLQYGSASSPAEMIGRLGCGEFVQFVQGTSLDYMSRTERKFDLIFLDGDHSMPNVYREVVAALKLLNNGGLILLHDYYPQAKPLWSNVAVIDGPNQATERLLSEGAEFEVLPLGALPWPTKSNSNITSLALVVRARTAST